MNSVLRIALGLAAPLGLLGGVAQAAVQTPGAELPSPALSKDERNALLALKTALEAKDYATAQGALTTAQSRANGADARYLVASLQLRLGLETSNLQMQAAAIDAMLASGAAPAAALPFLYSNQGSLALSFGSYQKAEAAYTRWTEVAPNHPEVLVALAEVKDDIKKVPEAVALIDKAIDLRLAAGQAVPESWYRRGLKHAFDGRMAPQSLKLSRELVAAYPTAENWRDALLIYRDLQPPDAALKLDTLRLMRAAKALAGERDYLDLATALNGAGLAGEAKAVLDEGVAAKMIDPAKGGFKEAILAATKRAAAERASMATLQAKAMAAATAAPALAAGDVFYGRGDYAKAAALYRAAVEKGAADPALVNTRLGMSLAMAGQAAEAQTAFRAVTGPRADLASLWLVWLAKRG